MGEISQYWSVVFVFNFPCLHVKVSICTSQLLQDILPCVATMLSLKKQPSDCSSRDICGFCAKVNMNCSSLHNWG